MSTLLIMGTEVRVSMEATVCTEFSLSISFDGLTRTNAKIRRPGGRVSHRYVDAALHALVKGELYIFGGTYDHQKVA